MPRRVCGWTVQTSGGSWFLWLLSVTGGRRDSQALWGRGFLTGRVMVWTVSGCLCAGVAWCLTGGQDSQAQTLVIFQSFSAAWPRTLGVRGAGPCCTGTDCPWERYPDVPSPEGQCPSMLPSTLAMGRKWSQATPVTSVIAAEQDLSQGSRGPLFRLGASVLPLASFPVGLFWVCFFFDQSNFIFLYVSGNSHAFWSTKDNFLYPSVVRKDSSIQWASLNRGHTLGELWH
jgi:hypothetical protein